MTTEKYNREKMPSINWVKNNRNTNVPDHGRDVLIVFMDGGKIAKSYVAYWIDTDVSWSTREEGYIGIPDYWCELSELNLPTEGDV